MKKAVILLLLASLCRGETPPSVVGLSSGDVSDVVPTKVEVISEKKIPAPTERLISFQSKPVFEARGKDDYKYHVLLIHPVKEQETLVWPDEAPAPDKIDPDRTLTIDVLEVTEAPIFKDMPDQKYYSLAKLTDGGKVLFDASLCEAHNQKMERKLVRISYGLPGYPEGYDKAVKDFPNVSSIEGGCEVGERTHAYTWVCTKCEEQSKAWWKKNLPER